MPQEEIDKRKIVEIYTKSNYRVLGDGKHSAIKPCHWQEQKLLTGRANRNCYKGYFGIESETCVQNTPALPFCNHQCVFCWRDIENGSLGSTWIGEADRPKHLVKEMLRHSENLIFEHITLKKSLDNYDLMHKVLEVYLKEKSAANINEPGFNELEMVKQLGTSRKKVHRAMLLLKNTKILASPDEDKYILHERVRNALNTREDIDTIIHKDVTTIKEIKTAFENAKHPKHAAISLAGEPTLYPYIGELVQEFRKREMCTFIVSNGTQPEVIRELWEKNQLPTQLYITLPAPNRESYLRICRPMIRGGWEKLLETLTMLPQLPCRTVVRITSVKYLNINLEMVPEYVKILKESPPDFIDIKGFTVEAHALEMQKRLGGEHELREYRPTHGDLMEFAQALEKQGGFKIIEAHEQSRDILLRGKWPEGKSIKIDFDHV